MHLVGFGPTAYDARRDLWEEIHLCRATILGLTSQLNMLADTACLPNELLSDIFLHYSSICYESMHNDTPDVALRPYTFIRVTHVCRHWRAVALQTCSLWSNIVVTSAYACVETMLNRSRPFRISIEATVTDIEYPQGSLKFKALEMALRELNRTRSLDLRLPRPWFTLISDFLGSPAPLLESITLRNSMNCGDSRFQVHLRPPTGRLKDVDLSGLAIDPLQQFSSSILRQFILKLPSSHCDRVSAEGLISTLASTPKLENLVLLNALSRVPSGCATSRASLPFLQVLNIADLTSHVKWIIDSLDISPYALINLDCTPQKDAADWSALGDSISSKRAEVDQTYPILAYSIRFFTTSSSLLLEGWESEVAPIKTIEDADDEEGESPLSVALPSSVTQAEFSAIFRALPLSNTVTLYLDSEVSPLGSLHLMIGEWFILSGALPMLKHLYLDGWSETSVVLLLSPNIISGSGSQGDRGGIIFPGLQKVVLRAVVFDASTSHDDLDGERSQSGGDVNGAMDTLSDGMRRRQEVHVPLRELTLQYCVRLRDHHVKVFRDVLSHTEINWDGVEQHFRAEWL